MVNFRDKLKENTRKIYTNPIQIYNTLDRQTDAGPLRPVQERILNKWFSERRKDKNLIVKLNTGEGKTLIGLLMLQSLMNEDSSPALYLCPNELLVTQTCHEAEKFGIKVCTFNSNSESVMPIDFLNGKKILVTTVQKLFNGKTIFGLDANCTNVGCILLDDSHACIDAIKSSFSIRIKHDDELYKSFLSLFKEDLRHQGEGTLMEIENGRDELQQIPYWAWIDKASDVSNLLVQNLDKNNVKFAWPLLRDRLDNCQAFITGKEIEISPIYCPIEKFGTFENASQRIFMSATTQDDSFFIKGFGFDLTQITNPLTDREQKWSGEKMILFPSLVSEQFNRLNTINFFAGNNIQIPRVAIVPSFMLASDYENYPYCNISNSSTIQNDLTDIKNRQSSKMLVLVNRYDGINLPDDNCRLLILDSLPFSDNLSDRYEMACREGSKISILKQVQKIEQGLGRSVRGEKDYSVIIIIGSDLVNFMMNHQTARYFSEQTKKQIQIASDILDGIRDDLGTSTPEKEINELIKQCINRDQDWKEYYRQQMDEINFDDRKDESLYKILEEERVYEQFAYKRNYEKACKKVSDIINSCKDNPKEQAWYKQILARYEYFESKTNSIHTQKSIVLPFIRQRLTLI